MNNMQFITCYEKQLVQFSGRVSSTVQARERGRQVTVYADVMLLNDLPFYTT